MSKDKKIAVVGIVGIGGVGNTLTAHMIAHRLETKVVIAPSGKSDNSLVPPFTQWSSEERFEAIRANQEDIDDLYRRR